MNTSHRYELATPIILGVARVIVGALWLHEGIVKLESHFGATDIMLIVDSTTSTNTRTPEFFQAFTNNILGKAPGFFGFAIPWLELGLGIALILGLLTLPAAFMSIVTLMSYWLSDQLVWQYPIMVTLAMLSIAWPKLTDVLSFTELFRRWRQLVSASESEPRASTQDR